MKWKAIWMNFAMALVIAWMALALYGICNAQTPGAQAAVVDVSAGRYGGSGVIADTDCFGTYWGLTAAHVVGKHKTIEVSVAGHEQPFEARVIHTTGSGRPGHDEATFELYSEADLPFVPLAPTKPAVGDRVWSAGYPASGRGRLVTRQGTVRSLGPPISVTHTVSSGDSGSPLFSVDGVVGIIGHAGRGSYATPVKECKLFGRRGGGCDEGSTVPVPGPDVKTNAIPNAASEVRGILSEIARTTAVLAARQEAEERRMAEQARLAQEREAARAAAEAAEQDQGPNWLAVMGIIVVCGGCSAAYRFSNIEAA